jgi:riboflavin biosynthesis pyrimidine reductase
MILGKDVPDSPLGELTADGIASLVCEGDERNLEQTLATLTAAFGIKRLILEGGAHTNAEFLKAGLVDELSLVLFSAIGGRKDSQPLFGGDYGELDTFLENRALSGSRCRGEHAQWASSVSQMPDFSFRECVVSSKA